MSKNARPLFAANWKMFKDPGETRQFVRAFEALYAPSADRRVVFFPPSISLPAFVEACADRPDLEIGAQDVHEDVSGAHTGAISALMVAGAGAGWCLAGHSERRREFRDDDTLVASKVRRILEAGLEPVVCVGETLEEREAGRLEEVLSRQSGVVLSALEPAERAGLVWAYEPVWAIGTGLTASPLDAAEAHALLRGNIAAVCGEGVAAVTTILYGGSVKPANIEELMGAPGVDGVLVGGASLDADSFAAICNASLASVDGSGTPD
jgi:triosephosphate isomerase